jgi:hypothetical protein
MKSAIFLCALAAVNTAIINTTVKNRLMIFVCRLLKQAQYYAKNQRRATFWSQNCTAEQQKRLKHFIIIENSRIFAT